AGRAASGPPRRWRGRGTRTRLGTWARLLLSLLAGGPGGLGGLDRLPHTLGGERHRLDVVHAERAQRVDDGVHHGGRRRDRSRLAGTLDAERVDQGRRLRAIRL